MTRDTDPGRENFTHHPTKDYMRPSTESTSGRGKGGCTSLIWYICKLFAKVSDLYDIYSSYEGNLDIWKCIFCSFTHEYLRWSSELLHLND